jgi:hypothetical protein
MGRPPRPIRRAAVDVVTGERQTPEQGARIGIPRPLGTDHNPRVGSSSPSSGIVETWTRPFSAAPSKRTESASGRSTSKADRQAKIIDAVRTRRMPMTRWTAPRAHEHGCRPSSFCELAASAQSRVYCAGCRSRVAIAGCVGGAARSPMRVCRRRSTDGRRRCASRAMLRRMASYRPRAGRGWRRRGSRRRRATRDRRRIASNRGRARGTVA